mmetsp:Transcript_22912/g.54147  ORF Transcript_22912/g.54147 Transcript_22912/m.54147 type:complete len:186 (+) Transcript_22912:362-919(+)
MLRTTLLCVVVWFAICFGWYGITVWIPTFLEEKHIQENLYFSAFLVAAANLPGNIVSALVVDRIGRRRTLYASMGLAAIFAGSLAASSTKTFIVGFACLFNAASVGGWNSLDILTVEAFPTSSRGTAMGFLSGVGRMAAFLSQLTHFGDGSMVLIPNIVALVAGCLAAWGLKSDTGNRALVDVIS